MAIVNDEEKKPDSPQEPDLPAVPDSYYVFRAERVTEALPWFWQKVINHLWRHYRWAPLCELPQLSERDRELLSWDARTLDSDQTIELQKLALRLSNDRGYYNPHAQAIKCGRCNPHARAEALALSLRDGWGYHQIPTDRVLETPAIQYGIHEYPTSRRTQDFVTVKPAKPFYWER